MHALKMAVFDFDGTLVDSVPAIARGIQLANEEICLLYTSDAADEL